jgi:hypothetical protein
MQKKTDGGYPSVDDMKIELYGYVFSNWKERADRLPSLRLANVWTLILLARSGRLGLSFGLDFRRCLYGYLLFYVPII